MEAFCWSACEAGTRLLCIAAVAGGLHGTSATWSRCLPAPGGMHSMAQMKSLHAFRAPLW